MADSDDEEVEDFDPEESDEVEVTEYGKRYNGAPKAKRVTCPAKPRQ